MSATSSPASGKKPDPKGREPQPAAAGGAPGAQGAPVAGKPGDPKAAVAAKPGDPKAAATGKPGDKPQLMEVKILGESRYDRISSFLMASVVGAFLVVGWLGLIFMTDQAYATRTSAPLRIVEVFGGGGGSPDGTPGSTEAIDVAGAEAGPFASNNMEEASEFEEPALQETPSVMLDFVGEAADGVTEADVQTAMPSGGPVASGKRSSKIGSGGPAFGFGPGDGGVPREQRWSIVHNPGQTADEYARQLDFFGIELATIAGGTLQYGSHFASSPERRSGSSESEHRLYFLWRGQGRKTSDVELLRRCGIEVGEGAIFQFFPEAVETALAQLEVKFRGRQPGEIRMTRFAVVSQGGGYGFEVVSQEPLR